MEHWGKRIAVVAAALEYRLGLNKWMLSVTPDVQQARIPSQLLQPLAENAIRHGIAGTASGGSIIVSARHVGNQVDIRVTDDGLGLPPNWQMAKSQGLGLSATRERLASMYPAGASDFSVESHANGGTEARISLPLTISRENRHEHAID